ncbi:MAG: hypothetical protein WKF65_04465 [Gaiellaceae bacterium]
MPARDQRRQHELHLLALPVHHRLDVVEEPGGELAGLVEVRGLRHVRTSWL